jgi:uncharacterized protein (TIGR02147 family)
MNCLANFLNTLFKQKKRQNDKYSLRAFASNLGIAPSTLSEILRKKRPISTRLRKQIGDALKLSDLQIQSFEARCHGNSKAEDEQKMGQNYKNLVLDSFYIVSQWYHYGILQLIRTRGFKNSSSWMAKRLGISTQEAKMAVDRLIRIGILKKHGKKLLDLSEGSTTHLVENFTNSQLKEFQIQALAIASQKIQDVPIEFRDNTSMTLAMSKQAVPIAKEEIRKFRRKLTKKLEAYGGPDEVYQLAFSLSPLTVLDIQQGEN